jgi:hypothetical protein
MCFLCPNIGPSPYLKNFIAAGHDCVHGTASCGEAVEMNFEIA